MSNRFVRIALLAGGIGFFGLCDLAILYQYMDEVIWYWSRIWQMVLTFGPWIVGVINILVMAVAIQVGIVGLILRSVPAYRNASRGWLTVFYLVAFLGWALFPVTFRLLRPDAWIWQWEYTFVACVLLATGLLAILIMRAVMRWLKGWSPRLHSIVKSVIVGLTVFVGLCLFTVFEIWTYTDVAIQRWTAHGLAIWLAPDLVHQMMLVATGAIALFATYLSLFTRTGNPAIKRAARVSWYVFLFIGVSWVVFSQFMVGYIAMLVVAAVLTALNEAFGK